MAGDDAATGPSGLLVSTVQSFNTDSVEYQDVPGGTLILPEDSSGRQWLVLLSASLRAAGGSDAHSAHGELRLGDSVVATAGYDNGSLASPLPWLTFLLVDGQEQAQVLQTSLRTDIGPSATIEDLLILAVPLSADAVSYLEDNPVRAIAHDWANVATLDFDAPADRRYLMLGTVTMREAASPDNIHARFIGPDLADWPRPSGTGATWLYNHRSEWATALIARVVDVAPGPHSFALELSAAGGEARDIRLMAIDTAMFDSVFSTHDLSPVQRSTELTTLSTLEVPAAPARDRVVLQTLTMHGAEDDSTFSRGRKSTFSKDDTPHAIFVRYNNACGPVVTDGVISLAQDQDDAAVWRNQVSGEGGNLPVETKESVIHVLTLAPQQN